MFVFLQLARSPYALLYGWGLNLFPLFAVNILSNVWIRIQPDML